MRGRGDWKTTCLQGLFSLCLAAGFLIHTGLVPEWKRCYSWTPSYRLQVEALLKGSFALSSDPAALQHDLVWARGGVQQVWGLGVPCWRLPFDLIAKACGFVAFPDRITLGIAVAMVTFLVLRVFSMTAVSAEQGHSTTGVLTNPRLLGVPVLLLVLFPPF